MTDPYANPLLEKARQRASKDLPKDDHKHGWVYYVPEWVKVNWSVLTREARVVACLMAEEMFEMDNRHAEELAGEDTQ